MTRLYIVTAFDKNRKVLNQKVVETNNLYDTYTKAIEFSDNKNMDYILIVDDESNNVIQTFTKDETFDLVHYERWLRTLPNLYFHSTPETKEILLKGSSKVMGSEYLKILFDKNPSKEELDNIYKSNLETLSFMKFLDVSIFFALKELKKDKKEET